jgi:ribonuclease HI
MCSICGLAESVLGTPLCLDCEAIRRHKFTDRTTLLVDGSWSPDHPTIGGAGIVLVDGGPTGEIVGQRYCGFRCHSSQDAEYEAILRAHRWTSEALIYSDAMFVVRRLQGHRRTQSTIGRQVRFLRRAPHLRGDAYHRAHSLSVQGRRAFVNQERSNDSDIEPTRAREVPAINNRRA